jgi:dihydropteroate synthase
LTGRQRAQDRAAGSAAAALIAAQRGAAIVRVHDVAPTRDALAIWQALVAGETSPRKPAVKKNAVWDED